MTFWPERKTALPPAEMQVNWALAFWLASRSPIRPPQPSFAPSPSGACACHTDCWSLCEKSFGGSGTLRCWYCVLVVGTTSGPTLATTTQYQQRSVPLPPKLYSHNDQQSVWQAQAPLGEGAKLGWGGRIGDLPASQNASAQFTCISAGGEAPFPFRPEVIPYSVGSRRAPSVSGIIRNPFNSPI